jgi:hypothetical protein
MRQEDSVKHLLATLGEVLSSGGTKVLWAGIAFILAATLFLNSLAPVLQWFHSSR